MLNEILVTTAQWMKETDGYMLNKLRRQPTKNGPPALRLYGEIS
jgi:hypothetical protein